MEKNFVAKCCLVVWSHVGLELSLYGSSVCSVLPPGEGYIKVQSVPIDELALAVPDFVPSVWLCVCVSASVFPPLIIPFITHCLNAA